MDAMDDQVPFLPGTERKIKIASLDASETDKPVILMAIVSVMTKDERLVLERVGVDRLWADFLDFAITSDHNQGSSSALRQFFFKGLRAADAELWNKDPRIPGSEEKELALLRMVLSDTMFVALVCVLPDTKVQEAGTDLASARDIQPAKETCVPFLDSLEFVDKTK
jgi:hypothetical protein